VIGQKSKMVMAVSLAVVSCLVIAGISFLFFPDQTSGQVPTPKPSPSITDQLVWAMSWLGFAALISLTIVGAILLVKRRIKGKTGDDAIIEASNYFNAD
jgi:multidrug efflux pump subunit AcrB